MAALKKLPGHAIVARGWAYVVRVEKAKGLLHRGKMGPDRFYARLEVYRVHQYGKRTAYGERKRWKALDARDLGSSLDKAEAEKLVEAERARLMALYPECIRGAEAAVFED